MRRLSLRPWTGPEQPNKQERLTDTPQSAGHLPVPAALHAGVLQHMPASISPGQLMAAGSILASPDSAPGYKPCDVGLMQLCVGELEAGTPRRREPRRPSRAECLSDVCSIIMMQASCCQPLTAFALASGKHPCAKSHAAAPSKSLQFKLQSLMPCLSPSAFCGSTRTASHPPRSSTPAVSSRHCRSQSTRPRCVNR